MRLFWLPYFEFGDLSIAAPDSVVRFVETEIAGFGNLVEADSTVELMVELIVGELVAAVLGLVVFGIVVDFEIVVYICSFAVTA